MAGKHRKTKNIGLPLSVAGVEINVTHERVSIDSVHLDPKNPRIRLAVDHWPSKGAPAMKDILELVRSQPGYDGLQKQIRKLGGIYDPVIVRHDGKVVEGNSRVTAVKTLSAGNPTDLRWKTIPVARLPSNVPEKAVAMLMANFHIAGKTPWRPSAKANQIYMLKNEFGWNLDQIADETRMTPLKVQQFLDAYQFLLDEVLPEVGSDSKLNRQDILDKKFSHALEFISGKKHEPLRSDRSMRKTVATLIAKDQIKGIEVRKLPTLMANKRAWSALASDGATAAAEVLRKADPTVDSKLLKNMHQMSEALRLMPQDDLELIKKQPKAKQILLELAQRISDVMAIAKLKLSD